MNPPLDRLLIPFLANATVGDRLFADDTSTEWQTVSQVEAMVEKWHSNFAGPKKLAFFYIRNSVGHVAALLGLLRAGHAVALLDPKMTDLAQRELELIYSPEVCVNSLGRQDGEIGSVGYRLSERRTAALHPSLALLLSTSGSTGSPKFVRLSFENLLANAKAISQVLDIRKPEVGLGHLPLHYSYGLSVLTSHLVQGAPVFLTENSFLDREFWPRARAMDVAHLPGVPFHYQTLRRFGLHNINLPSLRVMTQAGGGLDTPTRKMMHDFMHARSGRFHVMYGQTEASPRMSTLSHEDFEKYSSSVGVALPGGKFEILDQAGVALPDSQEGEVVYTGPNVMLGYAETRLDLAKGDEQNGKLHTGDIGRLDENARLTLTGRMKRFAKVAGLRISLDDVERVASISAGEVAVVQKGDHIFIHCVTSDDNDGVKSRTLDLLLSHFTISKLTYRMFFRDSIPKTVRGKIDYTVLDSVK
jgi:acyl-CoA synthetase (AMP-forming)/AMP-acid ligase II